MITTLNALTAPRRHTILIVEDSASLALACATHLEPLGHTLLFAEDGATAYARLRDHQVDCLLLDLRLPDMDGIEILTHVRAEPSPPAVVVMTSNGSLATAVQAVRAGAFDYLVKPFAGTRLVTTVANALATATLKRAVDTMHRTIQSGGFADFIGRSLPMQAVYRIIEAAAPSSASVFITGESGTGKELAAEALHRFSRRAGQRFVALNCGAIPRDLMESVIFGHVRGSFTGATADQEGAAARADGGTLFLDELGEMDPALQTKLLRFIQTGAYHRVGEPQARHADIRFIAATNRDPEAAVREGRLREDLFYRLNVVPLALPPLRARGEDILLIARRLLAQYSAEEGRRFTGFAPEVEARLLAYAWPGNVRQLQNVVRNVVVLHDGEQVDISMLPAMPGAPSPGLAAPGAAPPASTPPMAAPGILPAGMRWHESGSTGSALSAPARSMPADLAGAGLVGAGLAGPGLAATALADPAGAEEDGLASLPPESDAILPLARAEQRYIEHAIALCGGNLQLAARKLGISPSTIYRKREAWAKAEERDG